LSTNDEKSSGFPGGKGFSSDKSLSFNVSSSVLWTKKAVRLSHSELRPIVNTESRVVKMVIMVTWDKSCHVTCMLHNTSDHLQPADLPIPSDDCPSKAH